MTRKGRKKDIKSAAFAQAFLDQHQIRVWRQDVYDYADGHYQQQENAWLEKAVEDFLVALLGAANVSSHLREDVVKTIRVSAYLPGKAEPPFLMPNMAPLPAIVTRNVIVGLESLFEGQEPTFRLPGPDLFAIHGVDYAFDPSARCPRWLDFLRTTLGSDGAVGLLQEYAAWTWIGPARLSLQKVLWLTGLPGSGKSTILRVLRELFGHGSTAGLGIDALRARGGRFGLAPLMGKLANFAADAQVRRHCNVSGLNSIIAGDPIVLDRKFRDALTIVPSVALYFASNQAPLLGDSGSDGWWRRLLLLYTRPRAGEEREELFEELRAELPGILNWSLEPIAMLMANRKFTIPAEVHSNVQQLQEEATAARLFLTEKVELGTDSDFLGRDELMANFEDFCSRNFLRQQDSTEVQQEIKLQFDREFQRLRRGTYSEKEKGRKRLPGWEGLRWKPEVQTDDPAHLVLQGIRAATERNRALAQNEEDRIRIWQLENEIARLKHDLNAQRAKDGLPAGPDALAVRADVMKQQEYVATRKQARRSKAGRQAGLGLPLAALVGPVPATPGSEQAAPDPAAQREIDELMRKMSDVDDSATETRGEAS